MHSLADRSVEKLIGPILLIALTLCSTPKSAAQSIDTYMKQMRDSFAPLGYIKGDNCHNLVFETEGPWMNMAIPDGVDERDRDLTWSVVAADALRISVDLASLDEDKIMSRNLYDIADIRKHRQLGTPYEANVATVLIATSGPTSLMTVHVVDLDKAARYLYSTNVPENALGVTIQQRRSAFLLFTNDDQAKRFASALSKAIVVCKALRAFKVE